MSASNWDICPRCAGRASKAKDEADQAALDAYGKVPAEEWERMRAEASVPLDLEQFRTFREDYEFYGAERGVVVAVYEGGCTAGCGLRLKFRHEHPLDIEPKGSK